MRARARVRLVAGRHHRMQKVMCPKADANERASAAHRALRALALQRWRRQERSCSVGRQRARSRLFA